MEGIDRIVATILAEAEEKAENIRAQAETFREARMLEARAECERIRQDNEATARADAEAMIRRAQSIHTTELRKQDLNARQDVIRKVIQQALERLENMPDEEKLDLFVQLLAQHGITEGELVLATPDTHLIQALRDRVGPAFTVRDYGCDHRFGLLVNYGDIVDNLTTDQVVRNITPELSSLAAQILFDD